jgi:hypothetical protein
MADSDDVAERARQREIVRRGYDAISLAYRGDDGAADASSAGDVSRYAGWTAELAGLLPSGARVVDLGCGAGYRQPGSWPGTGCRCSAWTSRAFSSAALASSSPRPGSSRLT